MPTVRRSIVGAKVKERQTKAGHPLDSLKKERLTAWHSICDSSQSAINQPACFFRFRRQESVCCPLLP